MPQMQKEIYRPTGRPFHVRYKEHAQDFRQNNKKSYFAKHLLENNHSLHPTEKTMDILHTTYKGRMLDVIEKFYIYKETASNNQINDKLTVTTNIIFDTILRNTGAQEIMQKKPFHFAHRQLFVYH
jgi:hypothetical protein